jgi:hypothetical protein
LNAKKPVGEVEILSDFRSRRVPVSAILATRRGGGGGATPSIVSLKETTTMIVLGIVLSIAAIGLFCWLLFTLAVFALPCLTGIFAGNLAYDTGAGLPGAILIGLATAGLTLGFGQALLASARPLWARVLIAFVFVAPATIAGYHATHGIVRHTMPSVLWQTLFSLLGAIAVGATALVRVGGLPAAGLRRRSLARG